jgi:cytochrome c oxidase subunit I+III
LLAGILLLVGGPGLDILGQWQAGMRPDQSGYTAILYANAVLQFEITAAVTVMALFAVARAWAGRLDRVRRVVFDNLALFWLYLIGQSVLGIALTHGFPRVVS